MWLRDDGLFGVTVLANPIDKSFDQSFTSNDGYDDFPDEYDKDALLAWGEHRYRAKRSAQQA